MQRALLPLLALLAAPTSAQTVDYAKDVHPILVERCFECHGDQKQKGRMRFDTKDGLFGEHRGTTAVLPGNVDDSLLFEMVSLPEDDPDIMPPSGGALSAAQLDTLKRWIEQGASWTAIAAPEAQPDPLAFPALTEEEAAARDAALESLAQAGLRPLAITQDGHALDLNASLLRDKVGDAQLALLEGLAPSLAWLNLSGTAVTDAGLAQLAKLPNLQRLNLSRTKVTSAGLVHLKGLAQLSYLNLYDTEVDDAGLAHVAALPALSKLYLWGSRVSEEAAERLRGTRAGLFVNTGVLPAAPEAEPVAKPVNDTCPVSGTAVDPEHTSHHAGRLVAFCCEKCKAAFDKDPRKFEDKLPPVAGAPAKPANTECPVSGTAVDPAFTVEHDGQLVAFCCGKCKAAFEKDPAKFADKLPEKTAKLGNTECPVSGQPADAAHTVAFEGKTLGFCCPKCLGAYEKDPGKFAAKAKAVLGL